MIKIKIDMHIHTNKSDGDLDILDIVKLAKSYNIDGLAITDHDTTDAIGPAKKYGEEHGVLIIPGIEISSEFLGEEIHILGYFIDYKNKMLQKELENIQNHRLFRAKKIIDKLNLLNLDIRLKDILSCSKSKMITRLDIARSLFNNNYVESIEEAFSKYLSKNSAAYVPKYNLTLEKALNLINLSGGISVLAHPGDLSKELVMKLLSYNFDGLECIHPKHDSDETKYFLSLARLNKLIVTGGSDFHGFNMPGRDGIGKYLLDIKNLSYFRGDR